MTQLNFVFLSMGLEMTTIHSDKMDVKNLFFFTLPSFCNKTDITDILMWLTSCSCCQISIRKKKRTKKKVCQAVFTFQGGLMGFCVCVGVCVCKFECSVRYLCLFRQQDRATMLSQSSRHLLHLSTQLPAT